MCWHEHMEKPHHNSEWIHNKSNFYLMEGVVRDLSSTSWIISLINRLLFLNCSCFSLSETSSRIAKPYVFTSFFLITVGLRERNQCAKPALRLYASVARRVNAFPIIAHKIPPNGDGNYRDWPKRTKMADMGSGNFRVEHNIVGFDRK